MVATLARVSIGAYPRGVPGISSHPVSLHRCISRCCRKLLPSRYWGTGPSAGGNRYGKMGGQL